MRNLVLRVPTMIFIVLVLLPFLIFILQKISGEVLLKLEYFKVLSIIGSIVSWMWLLSVVDYFYSKAPTFKYIRWIYIPLALDFIMILIDLFNFTNVSLINSLVLAAIHAILIISAIVFLTRLIRTVFYQRAVWFIVLELLIVIVGITTLTPEIKQYEKELEGLT